MNNIKTLGDAHFKKRQGRKKRVPQVSREQVEKAVDVYLKNGGDITKLVNTKDTEMGRHKAAGYVSPRDWITAL